MKTTSRYSAATELRVRILFKNFLTACGIASSFYNLPEKPIHVSYIAGYFCRSTRSVERVFAHKFGVTIYQYLRNRRFAAACRELRQTDELIYVIAERFQLGSPGFFAREFRERFGMTPNEYRQKFKKSVGSFDRDSSFETIYDYIPYSQPDIMTITSEKKV